MGNNSCKCEDYFSNNKKLEKNLSKDNIYTPKTSAKNNNFSYSTNNFKSSSNIKNLKYNNRPLNALDIYKIPKNTNDKTYSNNLNKDDNKNNFMNNSLHDDINNTLNKNDNNSKKSKKIINVNEKKYDFSDNNNKTNKYRRNYDDIYKNLIISQSTKRLDESDLNSVIRKSTINEYK